MRIGAQVSKHEFDNINSAVESAIEDEHYNAIQIFVRNAQNNKRAVFDEKRMLNYSKLCNIYIHSTYSSVICKNTSLIIDQFKTGARIGAKGVVLHIPHSIPVNELVKCVHELYQLIRYIPRAPMIILEMISVVGMYCDPATINKVCTELVKKNMNKACMFCIDTAHLHGSGWRVSKYNEMRGWLDKLTHPEMIRIFHLNGSASARGSGQDVHQPVLSAEDVIFGKLKYDQSGVRAVVEFAQKYNCDLIQEINRGIADPKLLKLLFELSKTSHTK